MNKTTIVYLNSNDGTGMLAFGPGEEFTFKNGNTLSDLQKFIDAHKGSYLFGYLSYDLKNQIYPLTSNHEDHLKFPDLFLWRPNCVVKLHMEHIEFLQGEKDLINLDFINSFLEEETDQNYHHNSFKFTPRITKEQYLSKVNTLKKEIQLGNIYEVNFCQEFYSDNVDVKFSWDTYFKLNHITQAPFSSYVDHGDFTVFCGSPERFLKKDGQHLISQPIKGTAPRSKDHEEDEKLKLELAESPKERSENVMIVDLVRNDFSQVAEKNSVNVDELCKVYSYETVHQMISTVSCDIKPDTTFTDILKATFPMGSMTGAPKLKAMQLIEENEDFKRGLFSGSIGFIDPKGDFDFNVVIRTLLYNAKEKYLSCSVGSAITINSDPEKEYDECLVKIQRILDGMNA